jgi:predicted Fe-Mo cluster-binding NifX family protein
MKIAIPYWDGKVSPVLDTSTTLLILDFEGEREVSRHEIPLSKFDLGRRCDHIKQSGVELLICGAISRPFYELLEGAQVDVIPWISGQVEEVISAYLDQKLNRKRFLMPGCRWQGGRRGPCGKVHGTNRQTEMNLPVRKKQNLL